MSEPTDIDALIAEHRGVIAAFGDMSPVGNLSRRTIRELESTAAELRQERERARELLDETGKQIRYVHNLVEVRLALEADLARAREVIEKVQVEARQWENAPASESAPCREVGHLFSGLATYDQQEQT